MDRVPSDDEYVLQQTVGFQRVIQRAVNHVRSAEKPEVDVGDILASIFQEKDSHAEYFLNTEGVTRLDVLNYIFSGWNIREDAAPVTRPEKKEKKKNPLEAFTIDLVKCAAEGKLDPLIGRELEMERTVQILCRRRKNNPRTTITTL